MTKTTWRGTSWLHRLVYDTAWPSYECQQCVGQEYWQGCQCAYYAASGPCKPATRWHLFWRWVWERRG